MPNTDERRAKSIVIEAFPHTDPIRLEQRWAKFLAEKHRYGKPQDIADEFISRWREFEEGEKQEIGEDDVGSASELGL